MRTWDEAKQIFRENIGKVHPLMAETFDILDKVSIRMESAELMEGNWASYQPPKIKSHYQWSDFFENGRIIIRIDKNVMKSDQAILGIIAHELYELNAIRNKIGTNSIPAAALQRFINDVHSAAIDLQNRAVQQL